MSGHIFDNKVIKLFKFKILNNIKFVEHALVILIVFFTSFAIIGWQKLVNLNTQDQQIKKEIRLIKSKISQFEQNQVEFEKVLNDYQKLEKKFNKHDVDFYAMFFNLLKKYPIKVQSFSLQKNDIYNNIQTSQYNLQLSGGFNSILAFLQAVQNIRLIYILDNLKLQKNTQKYGELICEFTIIFYKISSRQGSSV